MNRLATFFVAALLLLNSTGFAATYTWTGMEDLDWDNPANWKVRGSGYQWPNEQYGIDSRWINDDCRKIDIANGDMVVHPSELAITGASIEAVLTLTNAGGLHNESNLWIGHGENGCGKAEVLQGCELMVDGTLGIADGDGTVGKLNVTDAAVNAAGMNLGIGDNANGKIEVKRSSVTLGGLTVGFYGISPFKPSFAKFELNDSYLRTTTNIQVGYSQTTAKMEMKNSTVEIGNALRVGIQYFCSGTLEVENTSLRITQQMRIGESQPSAVGSVEIHESEVEVGGAIIIAGAGTGALLISDSDVTAANHFYVATGGHCGALRIQGESVVRIAASFRMNDNLNSAVSEVVMDGGDVTVGTNTFLNNNGDSESEARFTLNGGMWNCNQNIYVGNNAYGLTHLTLNGGAMVANGGIYLGRSGGFYESRIFLNGGVLQAQSLTFRSLDSLIVYTGGQLRVRNITLENMENLIEQGKIDVSGAPSYQIVTDGVYTVLCP
jgi:hypothetical protein